MKARFCLIIPQLRLQVGKLMLRVGQGMLVAPAAPVLGHQPAQVLRGRPAPLSGHGELRRGALRIAVQFG